MLVYTNDSLLKRQDLLFNFSIVVGLLGLMMEDILTLVKAAYTVKNSFCSETAIASAV